MPPSYLGSGGCHEKYSVRQRVCEWNPHVKPQQVSMRLLRVPYGMTRLELQVHYLSCTSLVDLLPARPPPESYHSVPPPPPVRVSRSIKAHALLCKRFSAGTLSGILIGLLG